MITDEDAAHQFLRLQEASDDKISANIKTQNRDRETNGGVEASGQTSYVTKEGKPKYVRQQNWFPFKSMPIDVYVQKENAKILNVQEEDSYRYSIPCTIIMNVNNPSILFNENSL